MVNMDCRVFRYAHHKERAKVDSLETGETFSSCILDFAGNDSYDTYITFTDHFLQPLCPLQMLLA